MVAPAPALASTPSQIAASCGSQPIVYDNVLPELCPALEQIILGKMQRDRGRRTGSINVGGWKSAEDFFQWSDPAVQQLRQAIAEMVGARAPVAWAMVNRSGSHHPRHQHRVAVLTGIYYVTAGSPDAITPTMFECSDGDLAVDPHPGRLVLLSGAMWHWLPPYPGALPRIAVAFDVRR
jgi:hypothetical protein